MSFLKSKFRKYKMCVYVRGVHVCMFLCVHTMRKDDDIKSLCFQTIVFLFLFCFFFIIVLTVSLVCVCVLWVDTTRHIAYTHKILISRCASHIVFHA